MSWRAAKTICRSLRAGPHPAPFAWRTAERRACEVGLQHGRDRCPGRRRRDDRELLSQHFLPAEVPPGLPAEAIWLEVVRRRRGRHDVRRAAALVEEGERIASFTTGGGGYGSPAERDPEMVAHDIAEGYISANRAVEIAHAGARSSTHR